MSKLNELKKWLTVKEAAKLLSENLKQEFTESEILRRALDKDLVISLYLMNSIAKIAQEVPIPMPVNSDIFSCNYYSLGRVDNTSMLKICSDEIVYLDKIVDLPMLGSERLLCEAKYRQLCNEQHAITDEIDLVCVTNLDGQLYVLQEKIVNPNYVKSKEMQVCAPIELSKFTELAASSVNIKSQSQKVKTQNLSKPSDIKLGRYTYVNLKGLPSDSILVVRTDAIREFEESVKSVGKVAEKISEIKRILALIKTHDKQFDPSNMPGRKKDFQEFCIGVNKSLFQVAPDTFNDYLIKICSFGSGARVTQYYKNIASKLG